MLYVLAFMYISLWYRKIYSTAIAKGQDVRQKREKWDSCAWAWCFIRTISDILDVEQEPQTFSFIFKSLDLPEEIDLEQDLVVLETKGMSESWAG